LTTIKVINKSANALPAYETEHSAGLDLRASIDTPVALAPGARLLIGTGLFFEIPVGYEAQIRPRSGLALKYGITVLNAPGTIDADYRGEVKVLLINHGNEPFIINPGERVAQVIFAAYTKISWQNTDNLSETRRGAGGYGHTGKN
jgi:dUTP pyrophosphatase